MYDRVGVALTQSARRWVEVEIHRPVTLTQSARRCVEVEIHRPVCKRSGTDNIFHTLAGVLIHCC